jgi:hypothetical protein
MSLSRLLMQHHESPTILIRQRTQQDSVDCAKNGSVHTYAQCQCHNHHCRETRILAQAANAEAQVLHQGFEHRQAPAVAVVFLRRLDPAEFDDRVAARFLRTHPGSQVVFDVHLQMALDFRC